MAILALCNDLADAKERIGRIVVAFSTHDPPLPITCDDLGVTGAVAVLLKGFTREFIQFDAKVNQLLIFRCN